MPEQYIITRAYLSTDSARYISSQEVTEEILSTLEARLVTKEVGSITRLNSQEMRLMNAPGAMKWCIVTNWRLVCSDGFIIAVLRRPQSFYRRYLTGTCNAALSFLTYEIAETTLSRLRSSQNPMYNENYGGYVLK